MVELLWCSFSLLSIAGTEHSDQKCLGEENVYLVYSSIIKGSQGRKSSRDLEGKEHCLLVCFPVACSAFYILEPKPTWLGIALPIVGSACLHQLTGKYPPHMPNINLMEVILRLSSPLPIHVKLKKTNQQRHTGYNSTPTPLPILRGFFFL